MSSLDQNHQERQREKTKGRANWAKSLVNPRTLKIIMKVGMASVRVLYWAYRIIELIRS